ncbi:MAG: hypothetical protein QNK23_12745 [Crocinitomicaceae bacterium]|nr:hypothetical protein [Crocinitomicaceae bacterium]
MRTKFTYLLFCTLFLTYACVSEEPEPLNLEDIMAESENYREDDVNAVVEELDSTLVVKNWLNDHGIMADSIIYMSRRMIPDRFSVEPATKYSLFSQSDSLFTCQWNFADSAKTVNAFYNWIDCYGVVCDSYYIGQDANFQKKPFKILVSDTTIIYLEGMENFDFEQWDSFYESVGYAPDWNYVLEQRKHGKVQWYVYEDDKKVTYKK